MTEYSICSIAGCGGKAKWNLKAVMGETLFSGICSQHVISLKKKFEKEGYNVYPDKVVALLSDATPPQELVDKLKGAANGKLFQEGRCR
jgi:hypothetical protein